MEPTGPKPVRPSRARYPNPAPAPPVSESVAPVSAASAHLAHLPMREMPRRRALRREGRLSRRLGLKDPLSLTVVREYKGKQQKDANSRFSEEAQQFAALGYSVSSQSWAQGQWGCGAWLVALICVLLVGLGLLILAYMLIVKPAGTLTVTYTLMG